MSTTIWAEQDPDIISKDECLCSINELSPIGCRHKCDNGFLTFAKKEKEIHLCSGNAEFIFKHLRLSPDGGLIFLKQIPERKRKLIALANSTQKIQEFESRVDEHGIGFEKGYMKQRILDIINFFDYCQKKNSNIVWG